MTPRRLDVDVLHARLAELRRVLDHLATKRDISQARLESDLDARYATERMLALLVDLAVAINNHIAASVLGRGAADYRESFHLAARAEAISSELARDLADSVGLRNVLVHEYTAVNLGIVAASVARAVDGYDRYVREVAAFLTQSAPAEP